MTQDAAGRVVEVALSWVGRDFHPGQDAQCAPFVRHVFAEAGVPVASSAYPSDGHLLFASDGLSPNFADSFAGDDVGRRVTLAEAAPGDIVMFANTYGNWNSGVITHVGIYVGDDMMVDRSTSAHPVSKRSVYTFGGGPCEIRRARACGIPRTRLAYENGKLTATVRGSRAYALDVKVLLDGVLSTWVDNAPVVPQSVFLKARDLGSGKYYRLSMQSGAANLSVTTSAHGHGQIHENPGRFHCRANLSGGAVHVWIDGHEIRSDEVAVEIVHAS